ncbi:MULTISPECIES: GGDEF domain-containing protein [unclassified Chelatococcus]|uniref:sensor domain-containing diguanylate cyclase n=2 Tax=Chelatococcus TaxID=28209 RepID=UPI001BD1BC3A|nr:MULTISPECIES: GGDEF domain-containing protein [unclassified Chelatococcus]CAH1658543.1 Diguanylate cyclase (GGDEF)-like protein [Hyphomicrobiales bacterium]MBS7742157.1 sensor domain-containing diguanylate cyclase [Chelatococcus sp. HY11]MBX3542725.1 sensor domain-containing diguanylate cyclase [Chelatococcus sp.]MCO5075059.1 sensor domain-containing diguanylate cyclase [Chelatococcus sp.]CAH1689895.1 Diguanylate cyclase (GGDEF)-like protein [Hyphomicrobiales bacterium]
MHQPEALCSGAPGAGNDDSQMFELAPVSLWLEDYSGLRRIFDTWREAGVTDLRSYLLADPDRVKQCSGSFRIVKVNHKTLSLFEARDVGHLVENLGLVFRDDMLTTHVDELVTMWEGKTRFSSNTVNYTLSGKRLDIQLNGVILPGYENSWERVLVSIEDVSEREQARRRILVAEEYARGLFEHSPVSLWVEDFSSIKHLIDEVRDRGIIDFRVFIDVHPEFISRCMSEIRVLDVNQHTLELFRAPDKATLLLRLADVFRDGMEHHFKEQLIDLWNDQLFQQREVVNYDLDGRELTLLMQFSVLPGHEKDWSLVQIALTDISARKKAEAYLEYLGKHDVLTKLYNRSFFVEELNRLERRGPRPVTILMADLNGLKRVNDQLGHAAGDGLLRRAGEVLGKLVEKPHHVARIGGDEFAVLMPGVEQEEGEAVMLELEKLVDLNNQFYSGLPLTLSIGVATSQAEERLEAVVSRADMLMLKAKRAYYANAQNDRRRGRSGMGR